MDTVVGSPTPRQIGRFRVDSLLGRGGMGEVYRGYDPMLRRDVALKVVRSDLARPEFLERLLREALACARLQHPRIVTIYEASELDGYLYIAMEFLKGTGLDATLRSGPPTTGVAIGILGEVLDALTHAHEAGVIHRDIKPSNVHVQVDGSIKLLDFGLARVADAEPLTRVGEAMGTAHYASPEQLNGAVTDQRTDLYATGVLAYELFTGRRPFGAPGDSLGTIVAKVLMQPVPALDTDASRARPEFDRFIARAMAKRPEDRFATAREMRAGLDVLANTTLPGSVTALDRDAGTVIASAADHVSSAAFSEGQAASERATAAARWWTLPGVGRGVAIAATVGLAVWLGTMLTRAPRGADTTADVRTTTDPGPMAAPVTPTTGPRQAQPRRRPAGDERRRDVSLGVASDPPGQQPAGGGEGTLAMSEGVVPAPIGGSTEPVAAVLATEAKGPNTLVTPTPEETKPAGPTAGDTGLSSVDETAIRALLQAFEAAFASQSTPELRRLQPGLDSRQLALYDSRFLGSKAFVVELDDLRFRTVSAGRVAVNCALLRDITLEDDTHRRHSGRATVIVERHDGQWRVATFQPPGWW